MLICQFSTSLPALGALPDRSADRVDGQRPVVPGNAVGLPGQRGPLRTGVGSTRLKDGKLVTGASRGSTSDDGLPARAWDG